MTAYDCLWLIITDLTAHDWLWLTIMTYYEWFLMILDDYDWLWLIMTDYDRLWVIMTDYYWLMTAYDWSWLILTDHDWSWLLMAAYVLLWQILAYYDWFFIRISNRILLGNIFVIYLEFSSSIEYTMSLTFVKFILKGYLYLKGCFFLSISRCISSELLSASSLFWMISSDKTTLIKNLIISHLIS